MPGVFFGFSLVFFGFSLPTRLLIGCCGSGKTTVTSYALGASFRYIRGSGKLEADNAIQGFVMSRQLADVTRGLLSAEAAGLSQEDGEKCQHVLLRIMHFDHAWPRLLAAGVLTCHKTGNPCHDLLVRVAERVLFWCCSRCG